MSRLRATTQITFHNNVGRHKRQLGFWRLCSVPEAGQVYGQVWISFLKFQGWGFCQCYESFGCGSKLNHQGTAGFGPCCHLPGFHFGYLFFDPQPFVRAPQSHPPPNDVRSRNFAVRTFHHFLFSELSSSRLEFQVTEGAGWWSFPLTRFLPIWAAFSDLFKTGPTFVYEPPPACLHLHGGQITFLYPSRGNTRDYSQAELQLSHPGAGWTTNALWHLKHGWTLIYCT